MHRTLSEERVRVVCEETDGAYPRERTHYMRAPEVEPREVCEPSLLITSIGKSRGVCSNTSWFVHPKI